jgi:DNA repair photolyase
VSFSFSSVNDKISAIFEPGVPSPSERLKTLSFFKNEGIACGMFLLPVIPFITDTPELMEETIKKASEVNLDFIIFGGMTLKEGKQKDYFFKTLRKKYPKLIGEYENIYQKNKWGEAAGEYYNSINLTFNRIAKRYKMPKRIPLNLYKDILEENDLVVVILEHIDYLLKLQGRTSPYGYAAYSISQLKKPLSSMKRELRRINGVGKVTESIILEILKTRSSSYYEKLLNDYSD